VLRALDAAAGGLVGRVDPLLAEGIEVVREANYDGIRSEPVGEALQLLGGDLAGSLLVCCHGELTRAGPIVSPLIGGGCSVGEEVRVDQQGAGQDARRSSIIRWNARSRSAFNR
jgi:hypothetical protein